MHTTKMGQIRVAICDDEQNIRSYLSSLVRRQDPACEILEYTSAEDYLSVVRSHDLLFLDIELNGNKAVHTGEAIEMGPLAAPDSVAVSMDGMALARRLKDFPPDSRPLLIFVTGHENYVYDAFDVEAFQYLVKPIDEKRFAEVFQKAKEKLATRKPQVRQPLVIQSAGTSKVIPLEHIYYTESQGHKILLHLREGTLEYYGKIGELEQRLAGQFARIHKGYLVNLSYVEEYTHRQVTLVNGEKLIISKYKYDSFVKTHLQFLQQ